MSEQSMHGNGVGPWERRETTFLDSCASNEGFQSNWNTHARLDDQQWAKVQAALLGSARARARNGGNAREFVEMVLWMAHTRARWADLPLRPHASWHACYVRFGRWVVEGQWSRVIVAIEDLPETCRLLQEMVFRYRDARRLSELRKRMKGV